MGQIEGRPERAWTDPAAWLPADVAVTALRWRARWLASPAAVFLLSATAIVLAATWLIAAAVVVATIVSGHAVAAAAGAAHVTGPGGAAACCPFCRAKSAGRLFPHRREAWSPSPG